MERQRGRVEELHPRGKTLGIVLLQEDRRRAFEVVCPEAPLAVGDLVALEREREGDSAWRAVRLGGPASGEWDPAGDGLRWRRPGVFPSRLSRLAERQTIVRALRDDLYQEGFLEIPSPLLVRGTCPDLHIDSFQAEGRWLVTSTEYQLKRLLVGGCTKLFSLTQNFRRGDEGSQHNPEFTMLEWARAYETLDSIEDDAERMVRRAFGALRGEGAGPLRLGEHTIDMKLPFLRLGVRAALEAELGVFVDEGFSLASLLEGARRAEVELPRSVQDDAHDAFSYLMLLLGPRLGCRAPVFLRDWPAFMTSSASLTETNPATAERSELYIGGIEIADGFPSLRDPAAQAAFFSRELDRRREQGKDVVALDERYLAALRQGIPPGAGMALGVDRLVMVLCNANAIREVIPFAWDEL